MFPPISSVSFISNQKSWCLGYKFLILTRLWPLLCSCSPFYLPFFPPAKHQWFFLFHQRNLQTRLVLMRRVHTTQRAPPVMKREVSLAFWYKHALQFPSVHLEKCDTVWSSQILTCYPRSSLRAQLHTPSKEIVIIQLAAVEAVKHYQQ